MVLFLRIGGLLMSPLKKGDHCLPSNYRPVSLTSVVCKVMESIIKDAVLDHLSSNILMVY